MASVKPGVYFQVTSEWFLAVASNRNSCRSWNRHVLSAGTLIPGSSFEISDCQSFSPEHWPGGRLAKNELVQQLNDDMFRQESTSNTPPVEFQM